MAARIPDSLERLTQADLIGVVRDLIGEVGRLRAENEKLGGAFMTICCGPPRPRHPSIAIELVPVRVQTATDIERSIEVFGRVPNGGLVLPPYTTTRVHRDPIIALAARYRLPAPKKSAGTFRHSRPLANGTRWGCRSALCRFQGGKKTFPDTKTLLDAYCVPGKSRDQGKTRKNRHRWAWSSVHRTALVGRRHGQ